MISVIWNETWTPHWHRLSDKYTGGGKLLMLMAATCDFGVGVIARWTRQEDDSWMVEIIDTCSCEWRTIPEFTPTEAVLPYPPENLKY